MAGHRIRKPDPLPRVNVRRIPAPTAGNPDGGHSTLGFAMGIDPIVPVKLVIYDDAVDVIVGDAVPILLDDLGLMKLERLIRMARRNMPPRADEVAS